MTIIQFTLSHLVILLALMSALHEQPILPTPQSIAETQNIKASNFHLQSCTSLTTTVSSLLSLSVLFSVSCSGSSRDRYKWKCQQWSSYPILSAG